MEVYLFVLIIIGAIFCAFRGYYKEKIREYKAEQENLTYELILKNDQIKRMQVVIDQIIDVCKQEDPFYDLRDLYRKALHMGNIEVAREILDEVRGKESYLTELDKYKWEIHKKIFDIINWEM